MIREHFLEDTLLQFKKYKHLVDRAIAQVTQEQFFQALDPNSNSIAIMVKHMAGNMHSRWTDFLTTDGEKPDRYRDREFELEPLDTRERLLASPRLRHHAGHLHFRFRRRCRRRTVDTVDERG